MPESLPSVEAGTSPGRFSASPGRSVAHGSVAHALGCWDQGPGGEQRAPIGLPGSRLLSGRRDRGGESLASHHALPGPTPVTVPPLRGCALGARDADPPYPR